MDMDTARDVPVAGRAWLKITFGASFDKFDDGRLFAVSFTVY